MPQPDSMRLHVEPAGTPAFAAILQRQALTLPELNQALKPLVLGGVFCSGYGLCVEGFVGSPDPQ